VGGQVFWCKCFDSQSLYNTVIGKVNERGLEGMYEVLLDTAAPEFRAALDVILEVWLPWFALSVAEGSGQVTALNAESLNHTPKPSIL